MLEQTTPPLEILVCDDGSTDDTETVMRDWQSRDPRVRYLRLAANSGTPSTTRNLGLEHAEGELVAFLDDDDEWRPGKLAKQIEAMDAGEADVIATNAVRSGGTGAYFTAAPAAWRPTRVNLMRANPVITSSVLLRRDALAAVGGFPTDPRARGLEDYAAWLDLALAGARFLVIGEPLVRYDDSSDERLSVDRARIQLAVARLVWWHALRRPIRFAGVLAAVRHSAGVPYVLVGHTADRLRGRRRS